MRGDAIRIMRKWDKLTNFVHCLFTEKDIKRRKPKKVLKIHRGTIYIYENETKTYQFLKFGAQLIDDYV